MKNFRHEGRTCTFVATAAIKAGEGALFGIWFGVANNDAAIGEEVDGIPLDISWPDQKVAIDSGLGDPEREQLLNAGWALCAASPAAAKVALQATGA